MSAMADEASAAAPTQTYTGMLQAAAASGTDRLGDEIESLVARFESLPREDPQQALRDRSAAQMLEAAARSVAAGTPKALVVDVAVA